MAQIRTWKELVSELERIDGKKNVSRVAKQLVSICKCIKRLWQLLALEGEGKLCKKECIIRLLKSVRSRGGLVPKDNLFFTLSEPDN